MNLRPHRREDPDINLTPLIDVVFLMLIFFMVSTTFLRESSLELQLPEASPAEAATVAEVLELTIDVRGDYFVDGKALINNRPETLRTALRQALEGTPERPVVIRADSRTQHQALVTALDAAATVGISRLSIATLPPAD